MILGYSPQGWHWAAPQRSDFRIFTRNNSLGSRSVDHQKSYEGTFLGDNFSKNGFRENLQGQPPESAMGINALRTVGNTLGISSLWTGSSRTIFRKYARD